MLRRPGVQMTLSGVRNFRGTALLSTRLPRSSAYRRSLSCSVVLSAANATAGSSFAACMVQCRSLVVETNETPNPDCLRFFSMDFSFLKPEFSMDIPSPAHAYKSPLAEALFGVAGVQAIFLADEYVTVRKDPQADWAALVHIIKEVIVEFAESKENVLSEAGEAELMGYNDDTEPNEDDDEVVLAVKELLATRIRPMLRADGGNVRFIDMDEGTVFLLLEGACKSCPSSHITLKSGIERMLMHWIPEVVEVQEVSDEVAADILSEKRLRKQMKEKGEIVEAK
ncbi:Scaffold protein Nfu/NifU N terminal/NifU-like domain containing protein, putative [Leishmania lindenbergi]|uniref:Scaffold protein Nfu/NifU N terminal/NifU-like domain containing protein n=1 Tax=Leishmania lindenbergi TaxID=651832 RepID=A0AAW3AAK1_9TRYP